MTTIASYNVNGIRAAIRKGFIEWLRDFDPDIICLQELKAQREQLDFQYFEELGYQVYIDEAEKKGYSGVAILSKKPAHRIARGFEHDLDNEGRLLRIDFDEYSVFSVYMPSGASGSHRQQIKLSWLKAFYAFVSEYIKTNPKTIFCGDFNICHEAIDLHNPKSNQKSPGFTVEEREWFSSFLKLGFVDSFRHFNPEGNHYSWWSLRAQTRDRNLGWRIDYQLISTALVPHLKAAYMLPDARHSDHCPTVAEVDCK